MAKSTAEDISEFEYHYSFDISDAHLRNVPDAQNSKPLHQVIPIVYYKDKSRREKLDGPNCFESVSAFHRKLRKR